MRRTSPCLLLVVGLLSLFARDADALCAAPHTGAVLLTPLDADVPADGSLLATIMYGAASGVEARYADGGVMLPPLGLVQGGQRIPVTQRRLPGSLIRLEFARRPAPGAYTLAGFAAPGETPPTVNIGGTLPPPPAAPVLTRVTHQERHETYNTPRGSGRLTHWNTSVQLGQALRAGNAFLVLRTVGTTTGSQFFQARQGTTLEESGTLGERCGIGFVEGRGRVAVRAQVEAYVIDQFGRESPVSAAVRVR